MNLPAAPAPGPESLRETARRLLGAGEVGDAALTRLGAVGQPLSVVDPQGHLHSWFMPVTVGDRLGGFFQFAASGAFLRFSSFPRRAAGFDDCPLAADWLDPERVGARAAAVQGPEEIAGAPFLSFDGTPDRLAWAVTLRHLDGSTRIVHVIGDVVFSPRQEDSID